MSVCRIISCAKVAEAALRAGKHVLVEKPMALETAQCRALGRLAEESGLTLGVFFELRKAGTVSLARQIVSGGAIGEVRAIRVNTIIDKKMTYWQSPVTGKRHWRSTIAEAGGGVVLMNTVHQIDSLRFITGLEATRAPGRDRNASGAGGRRGRGYGRGHASSLQWRHHEHRRRCAQPRSR